MAESAVDGCWRGMGTTALSGQAWVHTLGPLDSERGL